MATTLYEDWHRRRQRLEVAPPLFGQQYLDTQARVLDYLIERYRDDEAAQRPARFPIPTDVVLHKRTIIVHHHMGSGQVAGVKSDAEAGSRVSRILRRIAEQDPQASAGAPAFGSGIGTGDRLLWMTDSKYSGVLGIFRSIHKDMAELKDLLSPTYRIEKLLALFEGMSCTDQELFLQYVLNCLLTNTTGYQPFFDFLMRCGHRHAMDGAALVWREYIATKFSMGRVEEIEEWFRLPAYQKSAAERVRAMLADSKSEVRLRAVDLLAHIGTLDDVGLLSDLLALPPEDDEAPGERECMLKSMHRLAGLAA